MAMLKFVDDDDIPLLINDDAGATRRVLRVVVVKAEDDANLPISSAIDMKAFMELFVVNVVVFSNFQLFAGPLCFQVLPSIPPRSIQAALEKDPASVSVVFAADLRSL